MFFYVKKKEYACFSRVIFVYLRVERYKLYVELRIKRRSVGNNFGVDGQSMGLMRKVVECAFIVAIFGGCSACGASDEGQEEEARTVGKTEEQNEEEELKHIREILNLDYCYYWGQEGTKGARKPVLSMENADIGAAEVQYDLGISYFEGEGGVEDWEKAAEWWLKSAEQGYARAQNNIGVCYKFGIGMARDDVNAVVWYSKGAEQGDERARYNLGMCYLNGQGVEQDYSKAAEWFRKAAEQGYADAQCNLGMCYEHGCGVELDYTMAVEWYSKAAEQGYEQAIERLRELE